MWKWGKGRLYIIAELLPPESLLLTMGIDESHFNVSLIVRDLVTRQCPQTTSFEKKGEP